MIKLEKPRDVFRRKCFERDNKTCVVCGTEATEVHHIYNRKLFSELVRYKMDYDVHNGVSLCSVCHIKAESNKISTEVLKQRIQIHLPLPSTKHIDEVDEYDLQRDTWGNYILGDKLYPGPLFHTEGCLRALKDSLDKFIMHYKYPSTFHLPWSPHNKRDDRKLVNTGHFMNRSVVITEKMDGENTTMYSDHIHARSLDSADHPSRSYVKGLHGQIKHLIPEGMRICGENLYAKHSIFYDKLESYFLVFGIYIDDTCLSWSDTVDYCDLLGLKTVPILGQGLWHKYIDWEWNSYADHWSTLWPNSEGYVVRVTDSFNIKDFDKSLAKYVRPNHVQTDDHWMTQEMVVNGLKASV